jgi:hypothetical protein
VSVRYIDNQNIQLTSNVKEVEKPLSVHVKDEKHGKPNITNATNPAHFLLPKPIIDLPPIIQNKTNRSMPHSLQSPILHTLPLTKYSHEIQTSRSKIPSLISPDRHNTTIRKSPVATKISHPQIHAPNITVTKADNTMAKPIVPTVSQMSITKTPLTKPDKIYDIPKQVVPIPTQKSIPTTKTPSTKSDRINEIPKQVFPILARKLNPNTKTPLVESDKIHDIPKQILPQQPTPITKAPWTKRVKINDIPKQPVPVTTQKPTSTSKIPLTKLELNTTHKQIFSTDLQTIIPTTRTSPILFQPHTADLPVLKPNPTIPLPRISHNLVPAFTPAVVNKTSPSFEQTQFISTLVPFIPTVAVTHNATKVLNVHKTTPAPLLNTQATEQIALFENDQFFLHPFQSKLLYNKTNLNLTAFNPSTFPYPETTTPYIRTALEATVNTTYSNASGVNFKRILYQYEYLKRIIHVQ